MLFSQLCGSAPDHLSDDRPVQTAKSARYESRAQLTALRSELADAKIDCYIVLAGDAHCTEYVGKSDNRLGFISGLGFGSAIISSQEARIWINGIYWNEAEEVCSTDWTIMKEGLKGVPTWLQHISTMSDCRIGIDDRFIPLSTFRKLQDALPESCTLVFPSHNLVDAIWSDRPTQQATEIFRLADNITGQSASSKLSDLRKYVEQRKAEAYLVSDLSEIAWLFNLRADDFETSPLFYAYALVSQTSTIVYVADSQLPHDIKTYLTEEVKAEVQPYAAISEHLQTRHEDKPLLLDTAGPAFLARLARHYVEVSTSPIAKARSRKNPTELKALKEGYLRDATAWIRWLAWLEDSAHSDHKLTEWDCAEKAIHYASQEGGFFGPSYEPLFQCGPNGAMPHYAPSPKKTAAFDPNKMIVADIGFQWTIGATTDTTRTLHMRPQKASKLEKRAFTRVLQGHIAIDTALFPANQGTGIALDALARQFLWKDGLNYTHGTGHGVGTFINVHEMPPNISSRSSELLEVGNTMSNEPGFYLDGHFGTRTESVITVQKLKSKYEWGDQDWLGFERLTRVPIQKSLVDWSVMTKEDAKWLHEHNELCKKDILPRLKHDRRALKWLAKQ